jgi:UDP-glucuronate decarboxylase
MSVLRESPLARVDPVVYRGLRAALLRLREERPGAAEALRGRRFLVSGGAGFLGSWLVDALYMLRAEKITVIDNLSTGSAENIAHLLPTGRVELIQRPVEAVEPLAGYDYVLHLAARPSPDDYTRHPVETLLVSSRGTEAMLESARRSDAVFLLTSTSEVYGHAEVIPTPETYWGRVNPVGPRSCYDEGKRYAEALTVAYARQYGLDTRISRIFNTYGPRLDWRSPGYGRVVVRFIAQALRGEPLTVHGDGRQTRSFLYAADNIDAHLRLLEPRPELRGAIVNIGNDEEITILELAQRILALTGSKAGIRHTPPRPEDPPRRRPDITRARRLLAWSPSTSLEEGLRETIEWIRRRLQ